MSNSGPPPKRARRSPRGSGNATDSKQLTITSMLSKSATKRAGGARAEVNSSDDVVLLDDDDLPLVSREGSGDGGAAVSGKGREVSPELFSEGAESDCDGLLLGDGGNTKWVSPCDNEELIKLDEKEPLADTESGNSTPVRLKSPSTSTRSSTHSPEIGIPPWDGAPSSEIHFGPSTFPVLPPLLSTGVHAVLFRPRLKQGEPPTPFPDKFKDVWDSNHVRMPCSSQSVFPVMTSSSGGGGERAAAKTLVSRWDIITESLRKPIANSYDLEEAILTYNSRKWNFFSLHSYFSDWCSEDESISFFSSVLPRIVELALSLPKLVTHGLPLLKKQLDYSISLSQQQVACLLANAFLCTFPRRNARGPTSEYANYPSINFNPLFSGNSKRGVSSVTANKLTCLLHYFTR